MFVSMPTQVAAKADSDGMWSIFNFMICMAYWAYARGMGSTVTVWQVLQGIGTAGAQNPLAPQNV